MHQYIIPDGSTKMVDNCPCDHCCNKTICYDPCDIYWEWCREIEEGD